MNYWTGYDIDNVNMLPIGYLRHMDTLFESKQFYNGQRLMNEVILSLICMYFMVKIEFGELAFAGDKYVVSIINKLGKEKGTVCDMFGNIILLIF